MSRYAKRGRDPRHDRRKAQVRSHILELLQGTTEAYPATTAMLAAISHHAYSSNTFRDHLIALISQGLVDRRNIGSDRAPCWAYWVKDLGKEF